MAIPTDLARLVPGFDFLQNLMKGAGAGLPSMGQWVAPTLDPEELEKRIRDLKTVQFWLESNAKLLGTTIQALEVQRMTLSTLQTMNLPMTDLRDALKIAVPAAAAEPPAEAPPTASPRRAAPRKAPSTAAKASKGAAATPAVDPMQWWGALTQQFTELATQAMKDGAAEGARNLAGAAMKQAVASAGGTLKKAATLPAQAARAVTPRKRRA